MIVICAKDYLKTIKFKISFIILKQNKMYIFLKAAEYKSAIHFLFQSRVWMLKISFTL